MMEKQDSALSFRSLPTMRFTTHKRAFSDEESVDDDENVKKSLKPTISFRIQLPSFSILPVSASAPFLLLLLSSFFYPSLFLFVFSDPVNSAALAVFVFTGVFFITRALTKCADFFGKKERQPVEWFISDSASEKNVPKKICENEGVMICRNGDHYEGEFRNGKFSGSGVLHFAGRMGRYEGTWVDGKYDGYGIESWVKGSQYRGQFRQGRRHGFGVYWFCAGDTYAGYWHNGQSHGVGFLSFYDGSYYLGEYKCGVKHGHGSYHFTNGDRYSGEYFGNRMHGFGVYRFGNGDFYEGSWHEGWRQGYGRYRYKNGDERCGEWECGLLNVSLPPTTESVVLRFVRRSREAEEKAKAVRIVFPEVVAVKAVNAAKRAAHSGRVAAIRAVQK